MRAVLVAPAAPPPGDGVAAAVERLVGADRARSGFHEQPPLALLLLASSLGAGARLHLEAADGPFSPRAGDDLVLVTFTTAQADRAYAIADACRAAGVPCVAGGIHASALPEEAAARFDAVCAGEAEALPEGWFAAVAGGEARGVFRAPGAADPARTAVPDYALPGPASPFLPLQATRGCPVGCDFCAAPTVFGRAHRPIPIPILAASLEALAASRPDRRTTRLLLVDDNLFLDRAHALELLALLARSGYPFAAYADVRLGADPELVAAAAAAGLTHVFTGLESSRPERLAGVSPLKASLAARYGELVRTIQEAGVGVFASFVVGTDADGPEVFAELAAFLDETPLYRAAFGFPIPYPGTPMRARLAAEGRLPAAPWSSYHEWNPLVAHPRMSREELVAGVEGLYARFYSTAAAARRIAHFKRIRGRRV